MTTRIGVKLTESDLDKAIAYRLLPAGGDEHSRHPTRPDPAEACTELGADDVAHGALDHRPREEEVGAEGAVRRHRGRARLQPARHERLSGPCGGGLARVDRRVPRCPWFVLGTKAIVEGERRDRPRSWFWVVP